MPIFRGTRNWLLLILKNNNHSLFHTVNLKQNRRKTYGWLTRGFSGIFYTRTRRLLTDVSGAETFKRFSNLTCDPSRQQFVFSTDQIYDESTVFIFIGCKKMYHSSKVFGFEHVSALTIESDTNLASWRSPAVTSPPPLRSS